MVEERTRIEEIEEEMEELLPELDKDTEKEEEEKEISRGLKPEHKLVWKELENQVHFANKRLKSDLDEFQEWYKNEEIKEMETSKKARNVIKGFGSLLSTLASERDFILGILKNYINLGKEVGVSLGSSKEGIPSLDLDKIVFFLCIDEEFTMGKRGTLERGPERIKTLKKISDLLNTSKTAVLGRLRFMLSNGYGEKVQKNLMVLLKHKKKILKEKEAGD